MHEFIDVDSVISAIGQRVDWGKLDVGALKTKKNGTAEADALAALVEMNADPAQISEFAAWLEYRYAQQ